MHVCQFMEQYGFTLTEQEWEVAKADQIYMNCRRNNRGASMEEDYGKEVREFYNVYLPLQRRYNLQMYAHFSIWEDGWIKICKKTGRQQKLIIKTESESDAHVTGWQENS